MEENICLSCRFAFRNGKCNRLVVSSIGMNDRLGSYYKKGNKCPYHEEGNDCRNRDYKPINFYNS